MANGLDPMTQAERACFSSWPYDAVACQTGRRPPSSRYPHVPLVPLPPPGHHVFGARPNTFSPHPPIDSTSHAFHPAVAMAAVSSSLELGTRARRAVRLGLGRARSAEPCRIGIHGRIKAAQLFGPSVRLTVGCSLPFRSVSAGVSQDAAEAEAEATVSSGPYDLLIVGPGVLGRIVAERWQQEHPGCKIFGHTVTTDHHSELTQIGIIPSLKGSLVQKVPYVIFCAPPYQTVDYPGDLRVAASNWNGEGSFLFTSSTAVYDCSDNGLCSEDSPCAPIGRSPRTDVLLKAENAVLEAGGSVLRLVGLYISLLRGTLDARPDHILNLIHYEDAASLAIAIMKRRLRGRVFVGCDNQPLSRQEVMDLVNRSGKFDTKFQGFTGTDGPLGKRTENSKTRAEIGWQPKALSQGLESLKPSSWSIAMWWWSRARVRLKGRMCGGGDDGEVRERGSAGPEVRGAVVDLAWLAAWSSCGSAEEVVGAWLTSSSSPHRPVAYSRHRPSSAGGLTLPRTTVRVSSAVLHRSCSAGLHLRRILSLHCGIHIVGVLTLNEMGTVPRKFIFDDPGETRVDEKGAREQENGANRNKKPER
ncbi:hypothetical protein GUJ93_ZPchr0008g11713 [Zizania palustris]|uniref:NAD-dependent epimerase/dehydratase domain-containing protein n=1 Tax=Zizania palustris TaxID=103762 RepID=A0A8J5RTM2_ZIZPA|nr:hypothetical protein GUJ93_ZPchr0008g11713 [Zizania palustris]